VAGTLQATQQLARFVRGNAASHPEDDATHSALLSIMGGSCSGSLEG
jgi:hypothetical protein